MVDNLFTTPVTKAAETAVEAEPVSVIQTTDATEPVPLAQVKEGAATVDEDRLSALEESLAL